MYFLFLCVSFLFCSSIFPLTAFFYIKQIFSKVAEFWKVEATGSTKYNGNKNSDYSIKY